MGFLPDKLNAYHTSDSYRHVDNMIEIILAIVVAIIALIIIAPSLRRMDTNNMDRRTDAATEIEAEMERKRDEVAYRERMRQGGSAF